MKQGYRLIARPNTFFSQLQWSTHHWLILVSFLGLAIVETQVGRHQAVYQTYATWLQSSWGLGLDAALWLVTFVKLAALVAGAAVVTAVLWFVGALFGRNTSRRVLFRRLAVVFTVFLAGHTASHLSTTNPTFTFASLVLFLWGFILGYHALRQQFGLNHLETVVVGLFALLLVTSTWHFTNHAVQLFAEKNLSTPSATAARPLARPVFRPR